MMRFRFQAYRILLGGLLLALAGCGDDYHVILFNGSGSSAMEATVRSLVADDETVLNVMTRYNYSF